MAYRDETFFDGEEIRDTVELASPLVYAGAFIPKTVTFNNTLDAIIDCDIYGCRKADTGVHFLITTVPLTIVAGSTGFETLDDYFQCFFLHVTARTTPTTGSVTAHMLITSGD